jgi:hypothetical protein
MSDYNKDAFGELVGRVGCGFAMLAIIVLILSILW